MKKKVFLASLLLSLSMEAQVFDFQKKFGGTGDEYFAGHIESADHNYVFTGTTLSNNEDIAVNYGMKDVFLTKVDADGNYLWKKNIGGNNDDAALNIINSNDGGIILLSRSKSNTNSFTVNRGNNDLWVTKLDINGNIIWNNAVAGSGDESNVQIIPVTNGYIMAVNTNSNDFDFSHAGSTGKDVWIIRLNEAGNIVWKKLLQGSLDETSAKLKKINDNNFAVLVNSGSIDGDYSGNTVAGKNKGFLFKLDMDGNILMNSAIESSDIQQINIANDVKILSDGYIITGTENFPFTSSVGTVYDNYNAYFAKISSAGSLTWKKYHMSGSSTDGIKDEGLFAEETSDNNYLILGNSGNPIGSAYGWMIKINDAGNTLKYTQIPAYVQAVNKLQDGNFVINGYHYVDIPAHLGRFSFYINFINSLGTSLFTPTYVLRANQHYSDARNTSLSVTNDNKIISF
ncbi:hypothetical protein [Chryseobacterium sp. JUb7]|uniref:hypothetical protein n=1 Tax=Chryseobacterium sp. JUb7 TaxID=2940599 RepID=UPI0021677B5A|nr:hypothetical protein [Chryseobacterium sp. JUb7]MCS3533116.1 hypothetical protein [Chryseobacterium sp. JUb7]